MRSLAIWYFMIIFNIKIYSIVWHFLCFSWVLYPSLYFWDNFHWIFILLSILYYIPKFCYYFRSFCFIYLICFILLLLFFILFLVFVSKFLLWTKAVYGQWINSILFNYNDSADFEFESSNNCWTWLQWFQSLNHSAWPYWTSLWAVGAVLFQFTFNYLFCRLMNVRWTGWFVLLLYHYIIIWNGKHILFLLSLACLTILRLLQLRCVGPLNLLRLDFNARWCITPWI